MGMILAFNEYHKHGPVAVDLAESQGMTKQRVERGDIMFIDQEGTVWTATSWQWFPRRLDAESNTDNPDFLKAVGEVDAITGTVTQAKSKGLLMVNIRDGKNNNMQIGKHVTKPEEPSKIENSDMSALGYKRVTRKGGQFQTLSANAFLEGHSTAMIGGQTVYVFKSIDSLQTRIISNMRSSKFPLLREEAVIKATEKFLDGGAVKFDWDMVGALMPEEDRRKFGIYLVSELCYPFWVWKGKTINGFPGFKSVRYFLVPKSSDTSGFDSKMIGTLIEGGVGKVIVSSKAIMSKGGKGANPSILPKLLQTAKTTPLKMINNKFLALLLQRFKNLSSSRGQGGVVIYPFMVHDVLRLTSIKDPVNLWSRIMVLHGKRTGKLTDEQMKLTMREVNAIQKKIQNGIPLPGIGGVAPLNQNAAKYPLPDQWKEFSRYLSDVFCDAIIRGINHDGASDLKHDAIWQVNLNNGIFIKDGTVHFTVKESGGGTKKVVVDNGKQTPGDPSRNITWLGMRPL